MALDNPETNGGMRPGAIVGGGILLVLGGTMFLDRAGIADIAWGRLIGPLFLILLGTVTLAEKGAFVCGRRETLPDGTHRTNLRRRGNWTGGVWLLGVGCWMLISQLHMFGLDYHNSWPLLIILSGIIMLVRGTR